MDFQDAFPILKKLAPEHRQALSSAVLTRSFAQGTVIQGGPTECTGLILVQSGQLRAFILSDEGREVTLYRLFDRDFCLFSASCILRSIQFDITIEAEKDTQAFVIPAELYKAVMQESAPLSNFTNEVMATRFTDVMWLIEQIMWKSVDKRLAHFLLEEAALNDTDLLKITHERIASHLGTAREVVTRMLRYFQQEGAVRLTRGSIELTDYEFLQKTAG